MTGLGMPGIRQWPVHSAVTPVMPLEILGSEGQILSRGREDLRGLRVAKCCAGHMPGISLRVAVYWC